MDPDAGDHRLEPEVPVPDRRGRRRPDDPGHHLAAADARRRLPRVRPAPGGHPDRLRGPVHLRRRAARHRAARGRAERHPGPGRHAVQVGSAAVLDRAAVQAGHRPAAGAPAGAGAHRDGVPQPAHLGGAAGHAGAGLRHRPGHADRHDVEEPLAHRDVDDGVLDDPGPAAARARGGQRGHLERAAPAHDGAGGADQDAGAAGLAGEGDGGHLRRGGLRPAQVLHRRGDRHRGHDRDAEPADRDPQRAADHHPGRPGQGARHRLGAARRRGEGGGGPPAADRRRDHRRPARAAARGGEAPLGEQPADDRGGRGRDPAAPAGTARDHVRHQGVPAGQLRQAGDRQPDPGAGDRVHPGRGHPRAVPVRVADGADQPAHHPALAGGYDARALLARRHHQHDDAGRPGDRAGRGGGRRDHRRGEHHQAAA